MATSRGRHLFGAIRGKIDPLSDGGHLIAEFEGGRVIETDASGAVVWEYVNGDDANYAAEITEAQLFRPGYFTVTDRSCPQR